MKNIKFAIQASSTSWTGGNDLCMNLIDGKPVIYWTIKNILEKFSNSSIKIIAPEFDKEENFDNILAEFSGNGIKISFSHSDSPLHRMIDSFDEFEDDDHLVRIDGLNYAFNPLAVEEMCSLARKENFDCVKFPDDYPIHFTFDVYKIGALRKLGKVLTKKHGIYKVHPKYYLLTHPESFSFKYYEPIELYSDEMLREYRNSYKHVFEARQGGNKNRISAGDQLDFHYEIAAEYVDGTMEVLDIASGEGYGSKILSTKAKLVIGSDYDGKTIEKAKEIHGNIKNVQFFEQNALCTSFAEGRFNLITSMETIEHVPDEDAYMLEMNRILKNGGYFIFSTPQNKMGHIPMNNQHVKEYSLEALEALANKYFKVEKIIGIKQGRVIIPESSKGTNTMMVCRK